MVRLAAEAAQQRLAAEAAQHRWEAEAAQQRSGLVGDGGGRPLIITTKELTGVSFGAMLTLHTVLRRPERVGKIAGCAFVAPFVDIPRPLLLRVQEAFAPILSALAPHARIVEAALPELLSKDAAAVENYVSDPLNIKEKISVRPGYLMGLATYWLKAHCAEWSTPVRVCGRIHPALADQLYGAKST